MENNMCPYATMVSEKNTYFISNHYKFIENDKIEEGTLLDATNNNLDPFLYHLGKCDVDSLEKRELSQFHICWPHNDEADEEDEDDVLDNENADMIETKYCNENNKVVKNFNQKCFIC